MAALLLSMLLASVLAYYLERTRREREAGVVLPFSGGYVLRRRGIPYGSVFTPFLPIVAVNCTSPEAIACLKY